jgi:hypothetical protein
MTKIDTLLVTSVPPQQQSVLRRSMSDDSRISTSTTLRKSSRVDCGWIASKTLVSEEDLSGPLQWSRFHDVWAWMAQLKMIRGYERVAEEEQVWCPVETISKRQLLRDHQQGLHQTDHRHSFPFDRYLPFEEIKPSQHVHPLVVCCVSFPSWTSLPPWS